MVLLFETCLHFGCPWLLLTRTVSTGEKQRYDIVVQVILSQKLDNKEVNA